MDPPSTPDDEDAGPLAALAVERVTDTVEAMHSAIVTPWIRVAGHLPGVGAGWRGTAAVYAAVRSIGAATAGAAAHRSATLGRLVPVGNALWGDELHDRRPADAGVQTAIVEVLRAEESGSAGPKRPAVLLHGLGETETVWHEAGVVDRLLAAGHPVALVRYNTGRSVAASGLELADAIDRAGSTLASPALVGFSMGGLVARAALGSARGASLAWTDGVEQPAIITIGAPHLGSPIEKGVEWASRALASTPYSRPLADFVGRRSAGIQDLRHGAHEPAASLEDTASARDTASAKDIGADDEIATIAGTVMENPDGPLGRLLGDLVVRPASASAVEGAKQVVFGGVHHSGLLRDERVQTQLVAWLAR